jgi:hypothetical protein
MYQENSSFIILLFSYFDLTRTYTDVIGDWQRKFNVEHRDNLPRRLKNDYSPMINFRSANNNEE